MPPGASSGKGRDVSGKAREEWGQGQKDARVNPASSDLA